MSYSEVYVKEIEDSYLDKFGMVGLDRDTPTHVTENGLYFSAIHVILYHAIIKGELSSIKKWYSEKVRECYLERGNLARQPKNNTNQEQWDNIFGVAVACIILNITDIPREILSYGVRNLFIFNTDGKLEGKDFLGRFPQVWVMMFAAAFPLMKYAVMPLAWLISKFMKKIEGNSSANNLIFVYLYGMKLLGFKKLYSIEVEKLNILENFRLYFKAGHPFILLVEENPDMLK